MAVCRLRERYRECLKKEIAHSVASPAEVDEELRHPLLVMGRRWRFIHFTCNVFLRMSSVQSGMMFLDMKKGYWRWKRRRHLTFVTFT